MVLMRVLFNSFLSKLFLWEEGWGSHKSLLCLSLSVGNLQSSVHPQKKLPFLLMIANGSWNMIMFLARAWAMDLDNQVATQTMDIPVVFIGNMVSLAF